MRPIVIVNFKTYPQATGTRAVALAKMCEAAGKQYGVDMRVAVQAMDLATVASAVSIPVYVQHMDPVEAGQHTGAITALAIRKAGGKGSLLNHAEHRMGTADIAAAVKLLRKHKLQSLVCAESTARLRELDRHLVPDLFCVEPPELIGGDVSVSMAQPDVVKDAVHATAVPLLVGAGVRRYEDLAIALELGAKGVLLASGVVLAPHREQALRRLLTAR